MEVLKRNIAPSSDEGHFIENFENIIDLDNVTESFIVKAKPGGKTKLTTKNHLDINQNDDCLINCQNVFNPFSKMFELSKD